MKIYLRKYTEKKTGTKWTVVGQEEQYIDEETYQRITNTDTLSFFRSLGGTEKLYRKNGRVEKLLSTAPSGTDRVTYLFENR